MSHTNQDIWYLTVHSPRTKKSLFTRFQLLPHFTIKTGRRRKEGESFLVDSAEPSARLHPRRPNCNFTLTLLTIATATNPHNHTHAHHRKQGFKFQRLCILNEFFLFNFKREKLSRLHSLHYSKTGHKTQHKIFVWHQYLCVTVHSGVVSNI